MGGKSLECLQYMECNSCLRKGVSAATTRRIDEAKNQSCKLQNILLLRESVLQEVERALSFFNEVFESRKKAFLH